MDDEGSHFYAVTIKVQRETYRGEYGAAGSVTPYEGATTLGVYRQVVQDLLRARGLPEDTDYLPVSFKLLPNDPNRI
ncbi:hypothetical protein ACFW6V_22525 [Streptomyces sp. NPDC058734]|uniref:hypothetical protein n=1 Tax=Streptomyces sp. NPDC058734 TaxID=3346615 RepID=UPI003687D571